MKVKDLIIKLLEEDLNKDIVICTKNNLYEVIDEISFNKYQDVVILDTVSEK